MPCENGENGYAAMGVGLTGGHAGGLAGGWRGARGAAMAEMHCGNAYLSKSRKRLLDVFVAGFRLYCNVFVFECAATARLIR